MRWRSPSKLKSSRSLSMRLAVAVFADALQPKAEFGMLRCNSMLSARCGPSQRQTDTVALYSKRSIDLAIDLVT